MVCGICEEETGIMVDGEPFCVLCISQQTLPGAIMLAQPVRHSKRDIRTSLYVLGVLGGILYFWFEIFSAFK